MIKLKNLYKVKISSCMFIAIVLILLTGCSNQTTTGGSVTTEIVEGLSVSVSNDSSGSPIVNIETKILSNDLVVKDLIVGSGNEVALEDTLIVNYAGYGGETGALFDSSFTRGEPATFPLGAVITGWQEGLIGMTPGGRRVLVIPSEKAYSSFPPPGSGILPGETLIFIVDLIDIK
jgi:peptidylprolyl isomerase